MTVGRKVVEKSRPDIVDAAHEVLLVGWAKRSVPTLGLARWARREDRAFAHPTLPSCRLTLFQFRAEPFSRGSSRCPQRHAEVSAESQIVFCANVRPIP